MTDAPPPASLPPAEAPRPAPAPSRPSAGPSGAAWIGIIAVALGSLVMVAGVVAVYLHARRLPPKATASATLPPPLPPETPLPAPTRPPAPTPSGEPPPAVAPPVSLAPFADD